MAETAFVYIIDDDASLRGALSRLFRSVGLQARAFASVREFLATSRENAPGCLVLDVRLPEVSGLDFQSQLIAKGIRLPVVLMTGYGDVPMSVRGMKAGAIDFLTKPFRDQDMLDAVAAGITADRARLALAAEVSDLLHRFSGLSAREQQVMELVSSGKMNKQVAFELGLSEITVKIHRASVMRKLAAATLADLVRMADVIRRIKKDRLDT